jgi:hypothetical protein
MEIHSLCSKTCRKVTIYTEEASVTLSEILGTFLDCDPVGYTPCNFVGDCQCFGQTCCVSLQDMREDSGMNFLRNFGNQTTRIQISISVKT